MQFYFDCMNNGGKMPMHSGVVKGGLCLMAEANEIDGKILDLFSEGQSIFHYWADEKSKNTFLTRYEFNDLRQTIILFMAAINNEL